MTRYVSLVALRSDNPTSTIIAVASLSLFVLFSLRYILSHFREDQCPVSSDHKIPIPPEAYSDHWDQFDPHVEQEFIPPGDHIYAFCPSDGRPLGSGINAETKHGIDTAVRRAANAQATWARTTFSQRRRVLRTLLKYVLDHQEEIVAVCCLDSGKTKIDACFGEILVTVEKLEWTIQHGERALSPSRRPTNLLMCYKKNTVHYEPLGVVAACVSWNYPFHNFISPIISATFSGNGILVKPSEQTCWSSIYFTDIVRGVLRICGHDKDLVQTVVCLPEVADHLTSHPSINHVTFIGSREIAHKVCASAAKALTPVTVELGGKDPAIVLDDDTTSTRLEEIAAILMRGVFQSAGQNCIGIERVIALPGIYDRLIIIIESKIEKMVLGSVLLDEMGRQSSEQTGTPRVIAKEDPSSTQEHDMSSKHETSARSPMPPRIEATSRSSSSSSGQSTLVSSQQHAVSKQTTRSSFDPVTPDMGAMISPARFAQLEELITAAVSAGATLHKGGRCYHHSRYPQGHYFMPTLLSAVHPGMAIAHTELFAPIFLLMKAQDVDEAITMSNSTPYALGATVFGHNKKDVQRCVKEIKAGMVAVNDFAAYYACSLPFGGVKGSGYGRLGGEEGLRSLCNVKAVCEDAWWARVLRIRTRIPTQLQYPIGDAGQGWNMCLGIISLGYGLGLRAKASGLLLLAAAQLGFTPKTVHQWTSIGAWWNVWPFSAEEADQPRRLNGTRQPDDRKVSPHENVNSGEKGLMQSSPTLEEPWE